ncbi:copper amine oxidase N-terminal domain-containing protein [Dehalobacterium formicoaceticum]|uniref:copper amine oxidase N-terminal domain-containing protein n=1 Tax=Dehalobacterium formicoaceticum TaxID=51515 RepID=UPI000B7C984D|nr:copper amine oxidase N-terminal domain-containing protein [Dehalobacterium formicoaceticum]
MKSLSLKNVSKKNVKKIGFLVTLLLVMVGAFCLFSTFDTANGQGEIKVICNNKTLKFDVQPRIVDNYVFVPFRTVFEALDAQVTWDEKTGTIKAVSEQSVLEINLHENTAIIKGNKVTLSPKPIIENGQTLLPLRFVSEALYARVSWDGARKTVYIEKISSRWWAATKISKKSWNHQKQHEEKNIKLQIMKMFQAAQAQEHRFPQART